MAGKSNKRTKNGVSPWLSITIAILLALLYWYLQQQPKAVNLSVTGPIPTYNELLPVGVHGDQLIHHKGYSLSYDEETEQAEWVMYRLTKDYVLLGKVRRSDDFRPDDAVTTGSASLKDYYQTGYDRGHLAPAGDMKWNDTAMSESFFLSNMSPQRPGFNRGIWKNLEEQVRDWAVSEQELLIVCGPVFTTHSTWLGPDSVEVPDYYYKVVFDVSKPDVKAIGFILPNKRSKEPLTSFAVSVDSVERFTGIDLFPELADSIEIPLEADPHLNAWKFNDVR